MKVALYNLEPQIENTAMMQVSQYHREQGDQVFLYSPLFHREYDRIYAFSIFQFTSKRTVTPDMICGGTGFNLCSKLPPEIEACDLDYNIFPQCETSYLWFSRGCIRQCPFCVVPISEGKIHPVIPKNLNPKGKYISVMDPDFFASPNWDWALKELLRIGQPVDFQQGIDIRIFDYDQGRALQKLKLHKQLRIAWDNPRENILPKIDYLLDYISKHKVMCYVLVGYWSSEQEDLYRICELRKREIDAYVMPYNPWDPYQKALKRWCNRHINCEWKDYKHISLYKRGL